MIVPVGTNEPPLADENRILQRALCWALVSWLMAVWLTAAPLKDIPVLTELSCITLSGLNAVSTPNAAKLTNELLANKVPVKVGDVLPRADADDPV